MTPLSLTIDKIPLIKQKIQHKGCKFILDHFRGYNYFLFISFFLFILIYIYLVLIKFPISFTILCSLFLFPVSALIFLIFYKAPKAIYFNGAGFGYQENKLNILFPWSSIRHSSISGSLLCIELENSLPGQAYTLINFPKWKTYSMQNISLEIEEQSVLIDLNTSSSIITALAQFINQEASQYPSVDRKINSINYSSSILNKNVLSIKKNDSIHFPVFCPSTGLPCDQTKNIKGTEISWRFSRKGIRKEAALLQIKKTSPLILLLIYFYLSYLFLAKNSGFDVTSIVKTFLSLSCLFLTYPFIAYMCRPAIQKVDSEHEGIYYFYFRDREYLQAFLALNT